MNRKLRSSKNQVFRDDNPVLIQGGMGLFSSEGLAGEAAKSGGLGVVAITGLRQAEAVRQLTVAREIAGEDGVIGVNVMEADSHIDTRLDKVLATGLADFCVQGAGFSRTVHKICAEHEVDYLPIVSRAKQVVQLKKMYGNLISAIIFEAKEAGGHIGDLDKSLFTSGDRTLEDTIRAADGLPIIAAGGITPPRAKEVLARGASGIQIATPYLVSEECALPEASKKIYRDAKADDLVIIESPAYMPGRAVKSELTVGLASGVAYPPEVFGIKCVKCIKHCRCRDANLKESFCIRGALTAAKLGNTALGLFFSGEEIGYWNKGMTVADINQLYLTEMSK